MQVMKYAILSGRNLGRDQSIGKAQIKGLIKYDSLTKFYQASASHMIL